jgi:adenylate cyclase
METQGGEAEEESSAVNAFLRSLGGTQEEIAAAWKDAQIARLAGDLVFAEGVALTAADVATTTDLPIDEVLNLWRALGVTVPDADTVMFSARDAEFTKLLIHLNPVESFGNELLRVIGTALSRVAEAAVSVYVQTREPDLDAPETDLLTLAHELAAVSKAALDLGDSMGIIFSHHMRDAIDRQRVAQAGVSERSLHRLAVGFVDLVGFTPLSMHTSPSELLELVGAFEVKAFDVAAAHNGRIVKHIGDEVMFIALDAADGCAIARNITATFGAGIEPRGGVCFGDVIARHGDYYGKVVNLASRLADLAIPGEVLVDRDTATSASGSFVFEPAGHRLLKGFDDPIEVLSLVSAVVAAS